MTNEEIIAAVGGDRDFSEIDLATALKVAAYLDGRKSGRGQSSSPGLEPEDLERAAAGLEATTAEFCERIAEPLETLREVVGLLQETETHRRAS
jgi:hypothetical protein